MRAPRVSAVATVTLLAACSDTPTRPEATPQLDVSTAATFRVNSTADAVDSRPGDGICASAKRTCTLRAAIQESNALRGADVITVPAGVYRLTVPTPAGSNALTISGAVRITGAGPARTAIDGGGRPLRILRIAHGAGRVLITDLAIQNGGRFEEEGTHGGGVLIAAGANVLLQRVAVRDNASSCCGAGIYNNGTLTLDRSLVTGNFTFTGAGIYNEGRLLVTRSTISGNGAADDGAGVANGGTLVMVSSTVSGNSATAYAGLSNRGTAALANVTVTRNEAEFGGSGIANSTFAGLRATVTLSNTIVAGNVEPDCSGTLTSKGYNLIGATEGRICAITGDQTGNKIGLNPRLGPLADNGGPTPTHALLAGSPAINAGNPGEPDPQGRGGACLPRDQRLLPRTDRCDMGAFEVQ